MKLQLVELPTVERRDGQVLFIFPSRPYWFAASPEVADIVSLLGSETDSGTALSALAELWETDINDVRSDFDEVIDLLRDNGVLMVNGLADASEDATLTPTHQVSEVERVLIIATTRACNLPCMHCHVNARTPLPDELGTEEIKAVIDQVATMPWDKSITHIALTGGEIFLRPDALELIEHVAEQGFHPFVNTNATLLNESLIEQLAEVPRLKVSISLDGADAQTHEYIRGPDTFDATIAAISSLVQRGVPVAANMFVHGGNLAHVGDTLELARSLGMQGFNCLPLMRVGRANSRRSQRLLVPVSEVNLYRTLFGLLRDSAEYRALMKRSTFVNQIMGVAGGVKSHYCGVGTNRALYLMADGSLYPCLDTASKQFLLGNLREDNLAGIWEEHPILEELRGLDVDTMNPVCAACDVRYQCGGNCRGEHFQVTGNITEPHFNCTEIRRSIIEMMWMLTEEPMFFQEAVDTLYDRAG